MKKIIGLIMLALAFSISAFAQENMEHAKPTDGDKLASLMRAA